MHYVMEYGNQPVSVYKFCKEQKIGEQEFYLFFGSFNGLKQHKELRYKVKAFATALTKAGNDERTYKITKNTVQIFYQGACLQFLFLLKYWIEDSFPSFKKTNVALEKSLKAILDIFKTTPLESNIDFGKFLVKENFAFAKA